MLRRLKHVLELHDIPMLDELHDANLAADGVSVLSMSRRRTRQWSHVPSPRRQKSSSTLVPVAARLIFLTAAN